MLKLTKPRTNTLKRSFSYHAANTWNKLPTDLKNLSISYKVFKHICPFMAHLSLS